MEYIFVREPSDLLTNPKTGLFKDLTLSQRVRFTKVYKEGGYIYNIIRKAILSPRINRLIKMPFKGLLYQFIPSDLDDTKEYCFIIITTALVRIDIAYIAQQKKKHSNYKFIIIILDSLDAHSLHLKYARKKIFNDIWDGIITFDQNDAKKYNFKWFGYSYYSSFDDEASNNISDIYYIGTYKGNREDKIGEIYNFLSLKDVNCNFNIVSTIYDHIENTKLSTINKGIPYTDVIKDIKSTNCILEILQEGQTSQSIRYFESVVYNKKLLSNNPNLNRLPFYNPKYMKYISDTNDIDWKWIKRKEIIDYHYNNEFSPTNLLTFLDDYFKKV